MNKLKYPIKYALLGIEEQLGWYPGLNQLERQYDICGYIVSKVYVVGETIKYNGDGTYRLNYQVVFPFISPTERIRQIPSYDLNCNCHKYINVNRVFDYYDSAKDICIEKNKKLRNKCYSRVSLNNPDWKQIVVKEQHQFDENFKRYMEFENFISEETVDMEITNENSIKTKIRTL